MTSDNNFFKFKLNKRMEDAFKLFNGEISESEFEKDPGLKKLYSIFNKDKKSGLNKKEIESVFKELQKYSATNNFDESEDSNYKLDEYEAANFANSKYDQNDVNTKGITPNDVFKFFNLILKKVVPDKTKLDKAYISVDDYTVETEDGDKSLLELTGNISKNNIKNQKIFEAFDTNKNDVLDNDEVSNIMRFLIYQADLDGDLKISKEEQDILSDYYKIIFGIDDVNISRFLTEIFRASKLPPVKTITTPNGDIVFPSVLHDDDSETTDVYFPSGDMKKRYVVTAQDKSNYSLPDSLPIYLGKSASNLPEIVVTNNYAQTAETNRPSVSVEYTEEGQQAIREFVLNHMRETNEAFQHSMDRYNVQKGDLEALGAMTHEAVRAIGNEWDEETNLNPEEDEKYPTIRMLSSDNYTKVKIVDKLSEVDPENFVQEFERLTGQKFNYEKADNFSKTASKYTKAKSLEAVSAGLKQAVEELEDMSIYHSQTYSAKEVKLYADQGITVREGEHKFEYKTALYHLANYFGSKDKAEKFLQSMGITEESREKNKLLKAAFEKLREYNDKMLAETLQDETMEELKSRYKQEYKEIYGIRNTNEDIDELIGEVEGYTATWKIGIVIATGMATASFLEALTGALTSVEGAGVASNIARGIQNTMQLAERLKAQGQIAQAEALFAEAKAASDFMRITLGGLSSTTTIATDVLISALNKSTSQMGIAGQADELAEGAKSSAKYIYFGHFVSGPLGQQVSNWIKSAKPVSKAFEGVKASGGVRSVSGEYFMETMSSSLAPGAGKLLTEIAAYGGLDLATEDIGLKDALMGSATMQVQLGILSRFLQSLMGSRLHSASYVKMQKEFLKNIVINESTSPDGKKTYSVVFKGRTNFSTDNPNELTAYIITTSSYYYASTAGGETKTPNKPKFGLDDKPIDENRTTPETNSASEAEKAPGIAVQQTTQNGTMQYMPKTERSQGSVELTKETFLQHLKDIGLDEDMVHSFAENIENGSIDLSACKDFIDIAKNDKELLSDLLGSIIFCDVKAEDVPAKIEAYKLAKSKSGLSVMDQAALILETSASKTPQQAFAEVVLSNKYEDIKNSDIHSGRKKAEMIQALKDCAEKNGAEFVLDNFELLSRNYKFASEVNANNLETAKLLDEYSTKMNRPVPRERALAILANPENYVGRIRMAIDNFEQSLERVSNNEMVSVNDFKDILKSMLSGKESDRESSADKIISKLPVTNGQVPSKAIELIKLIKENFKDISGDANFSVEQILSAATLHFDKSSQTMVSKQLTNEQVNEMVEYIKTLKANNSLKPPIYNLFDAMKFAKDINGDFSAKQILELFKKGLTIEDIDKMYNESTQSGDTNFVTYSVCLELAKYKDMSPEVYTFIKNRILNCGVRRLDSQYKFEVEKLLNNFKSNDINTISFLEKAFKDGYLDNKLPINRIIDFPVSDIQIAMYNLLPKPKNVNQGIRFFETLKNVNQTNAIIFEKLMKRGRTIDNSGQNENSMLMDLLEKDFDILVKILQKVQDSNNANLIVKGIDNKLFDTASGFDLWKVKSFVDSMQDNPEIAREWVDNSISFDHIDIECFNEFINGDHSNNEEPLTVEQRKLVYEIVKYRDKDGYPNINWTPKTRTALLELSPKNYELIKKCIIGTNHDFYDTAKFINECTKNQPEVLANIEKDINKNPKLIKYFSLETLSKYKDKVELLIEHEDLLESFKENGSDSIGAIFEQVSFDMLKDGLSILKDIPKEVKTKYKDVLAKLYIVAIANKIGMVPFKAETLLEVYKKAVTYEDDVAETLIKSIWREIGSGSIKHLELSNLDFIANYIKSKDIPDRAYIIKVLNSSENIGKNTAILTEILENKDKLLKQVAMRCQNTNPEFVKFVEEYLNSEDVYDLVFMPNLSINTLVNNFFEVSKIFQYVNTKPQDYINGHYDEKIIDALKDYRKKDSERTLFNSLSAEDRATVEQINNAISQNIDNKFTQILDAIASTDIETVKLLLDKRFSIFQNKMQEINELSGAAKTILSDVIRNGKRINKNGQPDKLTGQQKIDMIYLIKCATSIIENFDINKYKTPLKKGAFILDSDKLHDDIFKAILSKNGLSAKEISNLKPENLNWNIKYLSLLSNTPGRDEGELADVVKAASMGDFNEFINDVNNKYGQTNLQTRQAFESNGVNYEQWIRPNVADVEFEVAGKQCHIRMWDRNPQEDMFLGSKTSCCTALDRTNGGSMAVYMLNASYNVVELYDAKGDVVGMSRIFMAKVDGKPTLIMDNIELNHEFIKGMNFDSDVKDIRDNFFKYMNTYAEKITGDPNAQVLFYSGDIHVPNNDLTRVDGTIDFIGSIHREEVYVNAFNCSYYNPAKLKDAGDITWLKVPKE